MIFLRNASKRIRALFKVGLITDRRRRTAKGNCVAHKPCRTC